VNNQEQPQMFLVPATVLTKIINTLGERPFKEVAQLMMMIEGSVKPYEEKQDDTGARPVRQRKRGQS
jgi:hypothetical protein